MCVFIFVHFLFSKTKLIL